MKLSLFRPKSYKAENMPLEALNKEVTLEDIVKDLEKNVIMPENEQFILYCISMLVLT